MNRKEGGIRLQKLKLFLKIQILTDDSSIELLSLKKPPTLLKKTGISF